MPSPVSWLRGPKLWRAGLTRGRLAQVSSLRPPAALGCAARRKHKQSWLAKRPRPAQSGGLRPRAHNRPPPRGWCKGSRGVAAASKPGEDWGAPARGVRRTLRREVCAGRASPAVAALLAIVDTGALAYSMD